MRKIGCIAAVALSLACFMPASAALAAPGDAAWGAHRLGVGVNYWKTLNNLDAKDVHEDGFSYIASYQYAPVRFFKVEADLEFFPYLADRSDLFLAPEVFLTVGGPIYAGAGMGVYYHDGDWGNAPFYMLRAGVDLPILPRLFIDINVNYRFNDWNTLEWSDLDTDTIRLGAALRFTL